MTVTNAGHGMNLRDDVLKRLSSRKFQVWVILTTISVVWLYHAPPGDVEAFEAWGTFSLWVALVYTGGNVLQKAVGPGGFARFHRPQSAPDSAPGSGGS
jgi:hypothetical protein